MPGYGSGERADLHLYISKILCHYILMDGGLWTIRGLEDEYPKGTFDVHDWIANNITDRMDETIGFVVDRQMTHEEQGIVTRWYYKHKYREAKYHRIKAERFFNQNFK